MSGRVEIRLRGKPHSLYIGLAGGSLKIGRMDYAVRTDGYPAEGSCTWSEMRRLLKTYTNDELIDLILGLVENAEEA